MIGRITEQSRQDYLDAMGIQTWFPRTVLPNALAHRDFDFPEPVTEPEQTQELSAREAMLALGLPEHSEQPEPMPEPPVRPTLVTTPASQPEKSELKAPATV